MQRPLALPIYTTTPPKQNTSTVLLSNTSKWRIRCVCRDEIETTLQLEVFQHTLCVLYYAALQHQLITQSAFLPRGCKGTWP